MRGVVAVVMATFLVSITIPGAGKIVVDGPTAHATWGVRECLPSIGIALCSLACIFIGMWKRWGFEIVGWVILVVNILASGMR